MIFRGTIWGLFAWVLIVIVVCGLVVYLTKNKKEVRKMEGKWKEIYEFKDGTVAVVSADEKKKLMLLEKPHFIGVIDENHKNELLDWLIDKEYHKEGKEIEKKTK